MFVSFKTGVAAASALSLLLASAPLQAQPLTVTAKGAQVSSDERGAITIRDGAGRPLLLLGDYRLVWVPGETDGGTASQFTSPAGERGIQVAYRVKNMGDGAHIQGQFVPHDNTVHLRYDIWGKDDLNTRGAMMDIRAAQPTAIPRTTERIGRWQRDAAGGVPFLVPDTAGLFYTWTTGTALVSLQDANMGWQGEAATHFPAKKVEPGHFVAEGDIALTSFAASPLAVAAQFKKRPLALDIWTDEPFNVWDDSRTPVTLHTQSANVSDAALPVTLTWWARDFEGHIAAQGEQTRNVAGNATWNQDIQIPAPTNAMLFVEVQARSGTHDVFRRTNFAVLPPHQFAPPEGSLFGISAFFELPTRPDALALLQRIGVRWLRGDDHKDPLSLAQLQQYGIKQNFAQGFSPTDETFSNDPAHTRDWMMQQFKQAGEVQAPYFEIGNEWNMVGGLGKAVYARQYADKVLAVADAVRRETGSPVKIMSQGSSGADVDFMDALHEAGAWDHFDAFALHPGRGNYTADYEGWPLHQGWGPQYWNFLGSIRKAKERLAKYGPKPLFVTEAYACTKENSTWHDTFRHAAENVLLSYALAQAEGVQVMNWYQLNDSVWYDPGGINDTDPEYHYGLLNLDLSPKPSLLAYRTVAEALDGARFVRWLDFKGTQTKGLLFQTPRGPMSVLWNRADGYVLNQNHPSNDKTFAAPEPWVDDWPTKTQVTLPTSTAKVREINCIGQQTLLPSTAGKVTLTLDGAPRIYYGLSDTLDK